MQNLLKETLDALKANHKTKEDVEWIGSEDFCITWENFEELANVAYEDSTDVAEVAVDLMVVGKDFWLVREEYLGTEWWEFKTLPNKPKIMARAKHLTTRQKNGDNYSSYESYQTLNELNEIIK